MGAVTREEWPTEALRRAAEKIRTAPAGSRHDTLRAQSYTLAPYVREGVLSAARIESALIEAATEAGLDADRRREAIRTIQSGLDRGAQGEAWYPDDVRMPKHTTVPWQGKVYSLTTGRPIRPVPTAGAIPTAPVPAGDMPVTFFPTLKDTQGRREMWSWPSLADGVTEPLSWPENGKEGLPLWSWAVFEGNSRARRDDGLHPDGREKTRDAHIESVGALVLDYDDDPDWSLEAVRRWWGAVRYVAHTSAHHLVEKPVRGSGEVKPALPRGRVILALSRPVLESEWETLTRWVLTLDCGIVGEVELKSPRRAYYIPAAAPGGYSSDANLVDAALDVDAILREVVTVDRELQAVVDGVAPDARLLQSLDTNRDGKPRDHLLNLSRILEEDERWAGRLRWNEFTNEPVLDGKGLTDERESDLNTWMGNVYDVHPPANRLHEAVRLVCSRNPYHPVRTYLEGLTWDGTERLDHWLEEWAGVETGGELVAAYGRKFAISCVARVMQPGCKVDTTLILRGEQGARKSTLFATLAGPDCFADSALAIGDKDGYQQLQGVWIYELGELDSVSRRDWSTVKAFLTSQIDTYRPSYGRNKIKVPRQTVFVGTTNEITFLGDSTGSRRFWVVESAWARPELAEKHRDDFWAEAMHRFKAGEQWWLTPEEEALRKDAAGAYEMTDPWLDAVATWLAVPDRRRELTLEEIARGALERRTEDLNGGDEKRLGRILGQLGWVRRRVMVDRERRWRWTKRTAGGAAGTGEGVGS